MILLYQEYMSISCIPFKFSLYHLSLIKLNFSNFYNVIYVGLFGYISFFKGLPWIITNRFLIHFGNLDLLKLLIEFIHKYLSINQFV